MLICAPVWRRAAAPSQHLEKTGRTHAATDAHGHHGPPDTAPLALDQRVADHARTRHPIWVADRDRAAVDIVPLGIDAEPVSAKESLNRECFVELPQTNIVDLEPVLLQQLRHREHRTD